MNKFKRFTAFFLFTAIILGLYGCGLGGNAKYKVVDTIDKQQFCIAFRKDDKSADFVIAKLQELQETGDVHKLALKWFGEDRIILAGDAKAFKNLKEKPEKREYNIGYDGGRLPYSGDDKLGRPTGFDVELAKLVCSELKWKAKFIPIDVSQAEVELNSGNVDCVWGALGYDQENEEIRQSPVYMNNEVIVASLAGSKVRSIGSLRGKTLTVGSNKY